MRDPIPTIPEDRQSIPPALRQQLRTFWDELGQRSEYAVGAPKREGMETVTPIDIFCERSLTNEAYDSLLDFVVSFVTLKDFSEGKTISSIPRPSGSVLPVSIPRPPRLPQRMLSTPPPPPSRRADVDVLIPMLFPYRRLEVLPDSGGLRRRLWVGRDASGPIASYADNRLYLLIAFPSSVELPSRLILPRA